MRERRTAVRVPCVLPAHYSVTNRLSTVSARVTDLSVNGLSLETAESLSPGDHVTTNLLLPGEDHPLVINGQVRWCAGLQADRSGAVRSGIGFSDLDDTTHFCLQAFVSSQLAQDHRPPAVSQSGAPRGRTIAVAAEWIVGALAVAGLGWWVVASEQQNTRLRRALVHQTAQFAQLQGRQDQLQQTLSQERAAVGESRTEMERLQARRQELEDQMTWLTRELADLKQAYGRVQAEREQLGQQLAALQARFQSIPELRKAIRAAKQAKRAARRAAWRQRLTRRRETDQLTLEHGNRGYVLFGGVPTLTSARLTIQVHSPESAPEIASP